LNARENKPANSAIAASLLLAVMLWGVNNAGTKYLIGFWPPFFVGCTRFAVAGIVLASILRWTKIFGTPSKISPQLNRDLWIRGGLTLAIYTIVVNWALVLTPISHVAVYLGAAPVWALLWEGWPEKNWKSFQRYAAAALALLGVIILFLPAFKSSSSRLFGEILALSSSVLWTNYGRQCRTFGQQLSGPEVAAQTFWRCGVLMTPLALYELTKLPLPLRPNLMLIQLFCATGGGVAAYALWSNALRHWSTSQVYLFNNLIPLSTMFFAHLFLREQITPTFWTATILIISGVIIGQADWQKIFGKRWLPGE
jgi:drug/metabolite transporter (DMT)-like permease